MSLKAARNYLRQKILILETRIDLWVKTGALNYSGSRQEVEAWRKELKLLEEILVYVCSVE